MAIRQWQVKVFLTDEVEDESDLDSEDQVRSVIEDQLDDLPYGYSKSDLEVTEINQNI